MTAPSLPPLPDVIAQAFSNLRADDAFRLPRMPESSDHRRYCPGCLSEALPSEELRHKGDCPWGKSCALLDHLETTVRQYIAITAFESSHGGHVAQDLAATQKAMAEQIGQLQEEIYALKTNYLGAISVIEDLTSHEYKIACQHQSRLGPRCRCRSCVDARARKALKHEGVAPTHPYPHVQRILDEVHAELLRASAKHGPMHSGHEGYAVLLEEVDELWHEIKNNDHRSARLECIQVAAMALRLLQDVLHHPEDPAT